MTDHQTTVTPEATEAGWLCDTPWISWRLAVFDKTREGVIKRAEASREAKITELEDRIAHIRSLSLIPQRVEAETDDTVTVDAHA